MFYDVSRSEWKSFSNQKKEKLHKLEAFAAMKFAAKIVRWRVMLAVD